MSYISVHIKMFLAKLVDGSTGGRGLFFNRWVARSSLCHVFGASGHLWLQCRFPPSACEGMNYQAV